MNHRGKSVKTQKTTNKMTILPGVHITTSDGSQVFTFVRHYTEYLVCTDDILEDILMIYS